MADTDSPLKQLVESCILDFAAWLLNAEVQEAHAVNVELTGRSVRVDQLYRVALVNRRDVLLHIEFQGVNSHEPMPLRMLDYMARLVKLERELDLCSVVIYVGRGAGANDTGQHQINSADDRPSLIWRYQVIRLWQMRAEELLALQRPALLPLVGQTRIDNPDVIIPEVVSALKTIPNAALQAHLLSGLMALIHDEEIIKMIDRLVEKEELLTNTPFLRRIREQARLEALVEGRAEGRAEGRVEGIQLSRRQDILNLLVWRFDPPASLYQQIEKVLAIITDAAVLEMVLKSAAQAPDLAEFQTSLAKFVSQTA